jgi:hypothetical protein
VARFFCDAREEVVMISLIFRYIAEDGVGCLVALLMGSLRGGTSTFYFCFTFAKILY